MGRELGRQLAEQGCSVATYDYAELFSGMTPASAAGVPER
jgi:hypothetical protein